MDENFVDIEPEESDWDGCGEEQRGGHDEGLVEELEIFGAESLAADGLHGGGEAVEDGETGDIREGETQSGAGERELPQAAEEGGGDGDFGEPCEVHGDERGGDPPLGVELGVKGRLGEIWRGFCLLHE